MPPGQILFQMVVPAAWSQLVQAQQGAGAVDPVERFAALGELNAQLAAAAAATGNQPAQERFYGEAVAAYADGIRQIDSGGAPSPASAALHTGLAALYRSRVVQPDGSSNSTYAEQMAMEAGDALAGLAADDPRRVELERWQAEGLRLLVTDARRRGDVTGALALIDRLAVASTGAASAEFLANERQALVVEQALQFLAQGDRTAAFALAGNALSDPALQPPPEMQSLFAAWNIAAAISTAGIDLIADARPFSRPP